MTEGEAMSNEYVFRGGYIEDPAGDRWWSADLLKKVEAERDEARKAYMNLMDERNQIHAERDEARNQVSALRSLIPSGHDHDCTRVHGEQYRCRCDYDERQRALADTASYAEGYERQVQELRRERDQLLARLRAVYPWIGVAPFVPAAIAHLSLERDLARDSIEEISADIRRRGW